MNKKYLIFGIAAFFVIAFVTAGLVSYLSNNVQADVEVNSPIEQLINDGSGWEDSIISFESIYGGESIEFQIRDTNLANVDIIGIVENIITNPDGVTCDDFVSVLVTTETKVEGISQSISGPHDLILYNSVEPIGRFCESIDANTIIFSYGPTPLTYVVGQEDTSDVAVTFKTNALGTYTFSSTVIIA
jgi:hypothetical protein